MRKKRKNCKEIVLADDNGSIVLWDYPDLGLTWVMDVRASKRGRGNHLIRQLKKFVKKNKRTLYAQVWPTSEGMGEDRLLKLYQKHGATPVSGFPTTNYCIRYEVS